ncbi:MAG TPA: flagellar protein FlbB [Xanthobacteraceae bacterium]|nr:flagellar protein FlbB [Xanthobacteraceae bacterium]
MKLMREFRIIPVVLFAAICLLTLKVIGIVRGDGYLLTSEPFLGETLGTRIAASRAPDRPQPAAEVKVKQQSWAQEMFNYPDVTGSVPESKPAEKPPAVKKPVEPPKTPDGTPVMIDASKPSSPSERAILERLQERRQEIEARARELEIRDGLLKAAEMRLEARIEELKAMEARVTAAVQTKEDSDSARFKGLVSMYENMKPKDAAKIFDRLELTILVQVTSLINPRKMSDILGQMSPEAAERLTVELANRAGPGERPSNTADLPKIQGRPGG